MLYIEKNTLFLTNLICENHYVYTWNLKSESEVAQPSPTLCHPKDCSLPGSSIHGIFQARILKWVAVSFSRGSSRPKNYIVIIITVLCLVAQPCPTLCNLMDCSLLGSSIHRDSPGKNTGVVAMHASRASSQLRNRTHISCIAGRFFTNESPRKPNINGIFYLTWWDILGIFTLSL